MSGKPEITIRFITEKDHIMVLEHLEKNYYLDEPINKRLGLTKDRLSDHNVRYTNMLQRYPNSVIAIDQETGQIAGVLIVYIHQVGGAPPLSDVQPKSPLTLNYIHLLGQVEEKFNVFERYGVSTFPELAILSVDKKFRGRGIAKRICQKARDHLIGDGFKVIYAEFSNPYSKKIGITLGFELGLEIHFSDFMDKSGACMFPNASEEDVVSLMIFKT